MEERPQSADRAAEFGDPIAASTSWRPTQTTIASFPTRQIHQQGEAVVEIRKTRIGYIPIAIGILVFIVFIALGARSHPWLSDALLIFAVVWLLAGIITLRLQAPPLVLRIDSARQVLEESDGTRAAAFAQAKAVQIISDADCEFGDQWELNLVLDDGGRLHLLRHVERKQAVIDAQVLAKAIGIPVWDAAREVDGQ